MTRAADVLPAGNETYPWGQFDPVEYQERNYGRLLDDDRLILELVAEFFAGLPPHPDRRGIDMGSGANLYPALALLPLCREVTLLDLAAPNTSWLARQVAGYSRSWDQFWQVLTEHDLYRNVTDPRRALATRAVIRRGNLFTMKPARRWDVGTMFFTAESITADRHEFDTAVAAFLDCLTPGAPFAAAFVAGSEGYEVAGVDYPAVAVDEDDIRRSLAGRATDLTVTEIPASDRFRSGYDGLILATGHTAGGRRLDGAEAGL